jgi:hypothetical protein
LHGDALMAGVRTNAGLARAVDRLGCDLAALLAVVDVESAGAGFYLDGRPKILFESHVFSRFTGGKYDASHPQLSTPRPARQLYNLNQYDRLYQAVQLDAEAALQSCSWGLFQLMGFNWKACGERSLHGFVLAMHHNEDAHLALASEFIIERGLAEPLRKHDWATFAAGYNGSGYRANRYDEMLAAAYASHGHAGGNA